MADTDIIHSLAQDLQPVHGNPAVRRLAAGVAAGVLGATTLVAVVLGVQPGLQAAAGPAFVMKAAYALPLAALAFLAVLRLGRPGALGPSALPFLAPVALLAALAAVTLGAHPWSEAPAAMMGASWRECALRIAAVSLPVFVGAVLAMRQEAPTRLRLAGATAGLLAGASGAAVYALACPETSPAFVLVWYSAGMAIPTALGALLGPRLLRW